MIRIQMLCCGKLTCTNTVVVTWPPLNILVNRPCSSWPTLMGRECKRRIIRRQTPYRISVNYNLCFYLFTAMFTSALGETDVCIKVGKYHQLAYPEIFDLTVFQYFIGFVKSYLSNNRLLSFIVDTVRYEIVSCDSYKKILAMYFYFAISIVYSSLLIGFLFISLS